MAVFFEQKKYKFQFKSPSLKTYHSVGGEAGIGFFIF
jgi:hypothetical protein